MLFNAHAQNPLGTKSSQDLERRFLYLIIRTDERLKYYLGYICTTKDIHNSLQNGRKIGAPHYKQACLLWEIRTGLCELKGCASYERHAAYSEYQKVREMILMRRTHIRMRAAKILIGQEQIRMRMKNNSHADENLFPWDKTNFSWDKTNFLRDWTKFPRDENNLTWGESNLT